MTHFLRGVLCAAVMFSGGCACCLRREEPAPMPGAYSPAAPGDERVLEAAEFAVTSPQAQKMFEGSAVLLEIISAEIQVVAGTNYRVKLRVESGGEVGTAEAVVWRKLSGEYELVELAAVREGR